MKPVVFLIGGVVATVGILLAGTKKANASEADEKPEKGGTTIEDDEPTKPEKGGTTIEDDEPEQPQGPTLIKKVDPSTIAKPAEGLSREEHARIMDLYTMALLTGNPDKLEALLPQIDKLGAGPGQDARTVIAQWREFKKAGAETEITDVIETDKNIIVVPKKDNASVVVPAQPANPAGQQEGRELASKLALTIKLSKKGTEDRSVVQAFERQEGLKETGLYGANVAIALADRYQICPPKTPFYWGTKNDYSSVARDKAAYKAAMIRHANADQSRKAEWLYAAQMK